MSSFKRLPLREVLGSSLISFRPPASQEVPTQCLLFVGDVVGRPGRKVFKKALTALRECLEIPFVSLNGENLAGGFGITTKIYEEMTAPGMANAITMGNHWYDKPDIHSIRASSRKLVLPQNILGVEGVEELPVLEVPHLRRKVILLNLMGQFAMKDSYGDPFVSVSYTHLTLPTKA